MMQDLVSIIIPTYNRAQFIGETLDSVLAQTHHNWECLIVDDGSTDKTEAIVKRYASKDQRIKYLKRPEDRLQGGNAARNYGFEKSQGTFIQWFDDDDIMSKEYLSARLKLFAPNVKAVICTGFSTDEHLKIIDEIKLKTEVNAYKEYALWRFNIFTPSILFKKEVLTAEPFNESIRRGQETEFFTRFLFELKPQDYIITNTPLFKYRKHDKSKTERNLNYNKKYKEDLFFISKENFKRALQLKDEELVYFYYKLLIKQIFRSIDNQHPTNAKHIVAFLRETLNRKNKVLKIKLKLLSNIYLVLKRGYVFKKHLREHSVNF